jgi:FixJ family two-component response regulator
MNATASTVFVVDDEATVRKSLGRLLKAAGYRVETFASAREFLQRPQDDAVACLVLDVQMPELNGMDLQRALTGTSRVLPIVFITGHGDIPTSVRAMKAGATDFLSKPFDEKDLLEAIERALETARGQSQTRDAADEVRRRLATLTPREHEVLLQVITGRPNKQIADALGAGEKTIKVHRGRVMHKMQVQSVADLVRLCEKAGIRVP